jgi:hypothetical protein
MAKTEYTPTAPARIGTIMRNPLPKIEESGVVVAPVRVRKLLVTVTAYSILSRPTIH